MANEGDAREYLRRYVEALRLGNAAYVLDPAVFPNAAALKANTALGRLNVSTASGDLDGDGDFDRIDVFGARSVSIRDQHGPAGVGQRRHVRAAVADRSTAALTLFNTTNSANSRDNRSDDKGIEPESVVVGEVDGRPYAFVGLERDSGIVVLDVSTPTAPDFVTYANAGSSRATPTGALLAVQRHQRLRRSRPRRADLRAGGQEPDGTALLIVSNEVSSTTTVWQVQ